MGFLNCLKTGGSAPPLWLCPVVAGTLGAKQFPRGFFPLRMTTTTPKGEAIRFEVTHLEKKAPPASNFALPRDYRLVKAWEKPAK
jgi:hypothetical protein